MSPIYRYVEAICEEDTPECPQIMEPTLADLKRAARKAGWLWLVGSRAASTGHPGPHPSSTETWCPDHRPSRGGRR